MKRSFVEDHITLPAAQRAWLGGEGNDLETGGKLDPERVDVLFLAAIALVAKQEFLNT